MIKTSNLIKTISINSVFRTDLWKNHSMTFVKTFLLAIILYCLQNHAPQHATMACKRQAHFSTTLLTRIRLPSCRTPR